MKREIKLIILVFVLVVGPAIALSIFAAHVLEGWQIILQKRMAGVAGRVLDQAVGAWEREVSPLWATTPPALSQAKLASGLVDHAAGLSLQYPWLEGLYVFQTGRGLQYPVPETGNPTFERGGSVAETEQFLLQGGEFLAKGDTNSAIQCFERVMEVDERSLAKQRDSEEGFFFDLVVLKRWSDILEAQGQLTSVQNIKEKALERILMRYEAMVPLQRDSMVEWLAEGTFNRELAAKWRERLRGRSLRLEDRVRWEAEMGAMESSLPDSGWKAIRLNQADFLVTKFRFAGAEPTVFAMKYNTTRLVEHVNALFASTASNTDIRVQCQGGREAQKELMLALRPLATPFEAVSVVAYPENIPAFLASARLQMRLYRGGGALLLISVVAGIWLIWREAVSEIRQARERSSFAAAVSHDLRTPLSSMRMLAESLYMGNVTDEGKRKKFLGAIIKESDRLSRLTDRALYFIRYGQGALRYQFTEGNLGEVVREAVETFAVGSGVDRIKLELSPDLPPARFDTGAMEQVVFNLLDNAVKYSPKDKPVRIEVGLVFEGGKFVLSVRDYGVGMAVEEVRRVLKPYTRGKNAERQNAGGVGLGLALCQHIVQAHGGRIQIQSEPGTGSNFRVVLPG